MKSNFDFVGKRKIFVAIPIVILVVTIAFAVIFGVNVAIEFKGGTMLSYSYTGEIDTAAVKSEVESMGYGTVTVTTGSAFGSNLQTMTISFAANDGLTADVQSELSTKLAEKFADNSLNLENSQDVNPSSGTMFFIKCSVAVALSFVLLIIYMAFRFRKIGGFSAGTFALVALFNDIMMVFAAFVFFRFSIDANFMAVVLTILGYSLNSTIVVYDRVRENRTLLGKSVSYKELMNISLRQTLTRSINTTITTVTATAVICVVCMVCGVSSIISFAFPMLIGLLAGFYSSLCLAGPLWVMWKEYREKKPAKAKKEAE